MGLCKWGLFPETWAKQLYTKSPISAVNKLLKMALLKGSHWCIPSWPLCEWQPGHRIQILLGSRAPLRAALPAGVCVCPAAWGLCRGLCVYKRQDCSFSSPAAVKTVLENQTEVSTEGFTLEKTRPSWPTLLNERPSELNRRPLG